VRTREELIQAIGKWGRPSIEFDRSDYQSAVVTFGHREEGKRVIDYQFTARRGDPVFETIAHMAS
jgi:hypothetical protein